MIIAQFNHLRRNSQVLIAMVALHGVPSFFIMIMGMDEQSMDVPNSEGQL